jgi:fimbrial isopeptide formation D2 family protein/uncharacterized repeat protein (TIGR01451 family)
VLVEPNVSLFKGVVGSTKGGGLVISNITFSAPGAATAFTAGAYTNVNQSAAIAAQDLITDVLPDANDKVRFAAALQNTGRSDAFDVRFSDILPAAFVKPSTTDPVTFAANVNLVVQRGGSLTPLALGSDYTVQWDQPAGEFTVELVDNLNLAPGTGGLNRGYNSDTGVDIIDGSNGVIITYDLTLAATAAVNLSITNTARLSNYAGAEGAADHTATDPTETAVVLTASPTFSKAVTGTEINGSNNGGFQAVIGEKVTYTLTVNVPEGLTPGVQVVDTLDQGLAFVGLVSTTPSAGVTAANNPATVSIAGSGVGQVITFTLGNVQNNSTGNSGTDKVTLVFEAVVLNQNTLPTAPGNQSTTNLANTAQFIATGITTTNVTPVQSIAIVEPAVTVTKQLSTTSGGTYTDTLSGQDAGNSIFYRIVATQTAGTPAAFDLSLSDTFPAKLTALSIFSVSSTVTTVDGVVRSLAPADLVLTGNTLTFVSGRNVDLGAGGTITIIIQATAGSTVAPAEVIDNAVNLAWTSLDGDFSAPRTANNAASTERSGSGGVGTDTGVLNNYAAANAANTGRLTVASPVAIKRVVATSEGDTVQNRVLADFTNASFDGFSPAGDFTGGNNTWDDAGNITTFPQFLRVGVAATERGGGFFTYASPNFLDLRGYTALGLSVRALAGNAATPLWLRLRDEDGTIFRFDVAINGLVADAPRFSLLTTPSFFAPTATDAPGTTAGLDLSRIVRLEVRGDNGSSALRLEIDQIVALRTLAVPGEIIRYRLVTELPEGTSPSLELVDRLPAGMRFIDDDKVWVAFVANGGGIISSADVPGAALALGGPATSGLNYTGNADNVSSISLLPGTGNGLAIGGVTAFDVNVSTSRTADADIYVDGTDVIFKLGSVLNQDSDADVEYVIVEFNALVDNDNDATSLNGSTVQAGSVLFNDFQVLINGAASATAAVTSTQNDFNNVAVVEPQINNLSKSLVTAPTDAGDAISYQIKFSNNTAHPSQYAPLVRVATTGGLATGVFNATGGTGATGRFTAAPGTVDGIGLVDGDRVLVKNQATATQNGVYKVVDSANGVWDRATDFNTAAEMTIGYRTVVGSGTVNGGKTFALDGAVTTINTTALSFSEVAVSPAVRLASTANVTGTFAAGPPTTLSGIALTSGNLTIDGVNVALGDRILLKNQTGAAGPQNGIYTVTSLTGTATLTRATDMDASGEAARGFQVFVTSGTWNGNNTFALSTSGVTLNTTSLTWNPVEQVTAYDVQLTDTLPSLMLFSSLTVTTPDQTSVTFNTAGTQSFTGGSVTIPAPGTTGSITMNLTSLAPENRISGVTKGVTVTINGVIGNIPAAAAEVVNSAKVTYTSLPGPKGTASNPTGTDPTTSTSVDASGGQYGERDGSGVVTPTDNTPVNYSVLQRNNYSVGSTVITTLSRPVVDKVFKNGALTDDDTSQTSTTGASVAVGEQVTYDILVTLAEGTTPDLVVNDIVPSGMRLDSFAVYTTTGVSSLLTANFNGTLAAPTVTPALPATGTVAFSFGTAAAVADGVFSNNSFVIRVQATVLNVAGNISGTLLANTATVRFDDPAMPDRIVADVNAGNNPVVTVVEPQITLNKTGPGTALDAGDLILYTLTFSNSGTQAAFDVTLSDPVPAVVTSPAIVTAPGEFTATGFYDNTVVAASVADLGAVFSSGAFTSAPATLDGVTLAAGNRVLVKNQTVPAQNGVFQVDNAATGAWSRVASFDQAAEITVGYRVQVTGGTIQAGQVYRQTATVATVNNDPVVWQIYASFAAPTVNDFEMNGLTLRVKPAFALDLPPGASITIKIQGTVGSTYTPGQVISNVGNVQWTSTETPASNPDERTGVGGVNNYTSSSTSSTTAALLAGAKTLFGTDRGETSGANVTVGERVTYALKVTLPEGSTPSLVVTDLLPNGLIYESFQLITTQAASQDATGTFLLGADFVGTVPAPTVTGGGGDGVDVAFTFGAITVTGDNITANNSFLILVRARVLDVGGNAGNSPPGQTILANSGSFDIATDGQTAITTPAVNVAVVEPRMVVTKNIVQTSADASQQVTVTLTVQNTGSGNAYDVVLQDILSATFFNIGTVNFGVAGVDYPADFIPLNSSGTLTYSGGTIGVGVTRTFTFTVNLASTVAPGTSISNTATVTQATTLSGSVAGERNQPNVAASDSILINSHSIAGVVYQDTNNDGLKGGAEAGLVGVTITLTGTDHLGGAVSRSTTTGVGGGYIFTGLRPSDGSGYTVTESQPSGYLDGKETAGTPFGGTVNNTSAANSQTITAIVIAAGLPSTAGVNFNFGELVASSLAGRVFADANNNGLFNGPSDYGLFGVTLTLTGTDDRGHPVNLVTTTAADGTYSLSNLRPGPYAITETQPTQFSDGIDTVGTTGGTLANDVLSNIVLTENQNGTGYDFAEIGSGSIGDTVFLDFNSNDVADAGEGITGVTLTLTGDLNGDGLAETRTTVTGASGSYSFGNLPLATTYTVAVTSGVASGLTQTFDPDVTLNASTSVTLTAGTPSVQTADFGYRGTGQLGDRIFADLNGDGSFDAGEGLPGIRVVISGDADGDGTVESVTVTTGADGLYAVSGLRTTAGGVPYIVTVTTADLPAGLTVNTVDPNGGGDSTSTVSLTTAVPVNLNQDFGYRGTGQMGDRIFADLNGNGAFDTGEGLAGIRVTVAGDTKGDGTIESVTVTTGADGLYAVVGLRTAVGGVPYTVTVTTADLPAGLTLNTADPNGGGDSTSTVSLTTAVPVNLNQDFGYRGERALGNRVWRDDGSGGGVSNNGIRDGSEPGIDGVIVQLFAADAAGNPTGPVLVTTTTAGGGYYRFFGLADGDYVLVIPASNFGSGQPLASLHSSGSSNGTSNGVDPDNDVDNDDNGFNAVNPAFSGVRSAAVTLTAGGEPTAELDLAPLDLAFIDNSSNLTVDFGFALQPPTAVTLAYVKGWWEDGRVVVEWETLTEYNTAGFDLFRLSGAGGRVRVNEALIPALHSERGGVYRSEDRGVGEPSTQVYELVETETNGNEITYGPFVVTVRRSAVIRGFARVGNGILLRYQGEPGAEYVVEATDRLENGPWEAVGRVRADEAGRFEQFQPTGDGRPTRFFRALQP